MNVAFTIAIRAHHLKWIVAMHTFMPKMGVPHRAGVANGSVRFRNKPARPAWRAAAPRTDRQRAA
ncbi:hypothetical protein FFM54_05520 [Burkholderia pseudomallei]|nr:hypothetical protein BURPS668_A3034 [Burkholderia pseudomallei 668]AUG25442.1 hypothetical protein CXQ84_35145 [Burkholderia pseudomallei]EXJ02933.1 hypothetical protein T210_0104975 [Burkholderia pseudomallei MSHR6137]KAA8760006.1 hypothetical protein F5D26_35885 [Burkholderia pseudomallei]PJO54515.1 hypothetical protein CWD85_37385 [Burkholderia pseudomallei]